MYTYMAINTLNGKFYIGSTKNFRKRKRSHLRSKENYPFQNSLRGNPDAFDWVVWKDDYDEPVMEQALLDMWFGKGCCYNLCSSAIRPPSMTGKKMWVSEDGRQTFSDTCPGGGWVRGVNDDRRIQNSNSRKGKKDSNETKCKKSKSHKGKKRSFSEDHKANISNSRKGISNGRRGGLAAGKLNVELGKGFCNPDYTNSKECMENRIRASLKGAKAISKPVIVELPMGEKKLYPSISSAAREMGLKAQSLGALARSGKVGQKGDYVGIKVSFAEGKINQ